MTSSSDYYKPGSSALHVVVCAAFLWLLISNKHYRGKGRLPFIKLSFISAKRLISSTGTMVPEEKLSVHTSRKQPPLHLLINERNGSIFFVVVIIRLHCLFLFFLLPVDEIGRSYTVLPKYLESFIRFNFTAIE